VIADHNEPWAVGVAPLPVNTVGGRRMSAALTHLEAARSRPNLTDIATGGDHHARSLTATLAAAQHSGWTFDEQLWAVSVEVGRQTISRW